VFLGPVIDNHQPVFMPVHHYPVRIDVQMLGHDLIVNVKITDQYQFRKVGTRQQLPHLTDVTKIIGMPPGFSAVNTSHDLTKLMSQDIPFIAPRQSLKGFIEIFDFEIMIGQKNGLRMMFNDLIDQSVGFLQFFKFELHGI